MQSLCFNAIQASAYFIFQC